MKKVAVKSALSGAALAAAVDLFSQRKEKYKKGRGATAAAAGAIGGVALSRLMKQIARESSKAATGEAKKNLSYVGKKIVFNK